MQKPCFSIRPPVGLVLVLLAIGTLPAEAVFPLPKEGVSPFRRDRLTLPPDQQQTLADQLILVARVSPPDTAAQRRVKAQALAVALILSPGKEEARELLQRLSKGMEMDPVDSGLVDRFFIEKTYKWLDTRPGNDSRTLAACLKGILYPTEAGEDQEAIWENWIPGEKAYEKISVPAAEASSPLPASPATASKNEQPFKMATGKMGVLVTATDWKTKNKTRMILNLKMDTLPSENFAFAGNLGKWVLKLRSFLEKRHPELPKGTIDLTLQTRKGDLPFGEDELSAAAFVLADAAITGSEPESVVMGRISNESYQLPPDFWETLSAAPIEKSHGRLILPSTAAEYLPAFLVLDKAGFFLKYEICLASSPEDLLARAAKVSSEEAAAAHRRFEALMEQAEKVEVTAFLADPKVRLQLEEICKVLPYHASARMLALQAAGKRPTTLPRKVTAAALQNALIPMEWAGKSTQYPDTNAVERIEAAYESSRSRLWSFEKVVDPSDGRLLIEFNEVLSKFRALGRSYKSKDVDYYGSAGIEKSFIAFSKAYLSLQEHLESAKTGKTGP